MHRRVLLTLAGCVLLAACSSNASQSAGPTGGTGTGTGATGNTGTAATATTSTVPSGLTGYGATIAAWNATHTKDPDYEGLMAYGPTIATPEGPTPQFIDVTSDGQRIIKYIEVLPDGTSLDEAQTAVRVDLPSDAVAQSLNISHTAAALGQTSSCAFWNLSSATLGSDTISPYVEVEMSYNDSVGAPYWRPNNVNTLTFIFGRGLTTDVC